MSHRPIILSCAIVEVIDGNTLIAVCEPSDSALDSSPWSRPRTLTIRMADVAAPTLEQPHGEEARQAMAEMCLGDSSATVVIHGLDDRGIHLAALECRGIEPARSLLQRGLARCLQQDSGPFSLRQAEEEARQAKRGLWGTVGAG